MTRDSIAPLLLVAPDSQLPARLRVWGTGGWLPPDEREALDWLTFARTLGWGVDLATPDAVSIARRHARGRRWIVLGCDPESLPRDVIELLRSLLHDEPVVIIGRAGSTGLPWSELAGVATTGDSVAGLDLRWQGDPPEKWSCRQPFLAHRIALASAVSAMADIDGRPVVAARQVGRGCVVTLAFHPSKARDENGVATTLLRKTMIGSSLGAIAWIDHSGAVALRMDDPGSAQNVHLSNWRYRQLDGSEWARIGANLHARDARLSVGYVGGWVDDGDAMRGSLTVGCAAVPRRPGAVHPSAEVVYRSLDDPAPGVLHDYAGQYRALQAHRRAGIVDIELHGYTHMDPDLASWARAADRYDNVAWYRELGARAQTRLANLSREDHPLARGIAQIEHYFGCRPSTLICPGDAWTNEALGVALALGLGGVSSYYFALRHDDRFCWVQHVCAPYLDEAEPRWFDSGLPVVGYFHDRDLALSGPDWLGRGLDAWRQAGARKFVTLRELTAAFGARLEVREAADGCELDVDGVCAGGEGAVVPVRVELPGARVPSWVDVRVGSASRATRVEAGADGVLQIRLAAFDVRP